MPNFSGVWNLKDQVQAIAAGRWTGIPLGELYTWGANAGAGPGRLGDGTVVNKSSPVQIGILTDWSQVAAGESHTAAVKTNGTLWAWGSNVNGQIGDNTSVARSSPVQIGALTNWSQVSVSVGSASTAAVKTTGTLWAWGRNDFGQLGQNTASGLVFVSSPVQIGALTNWAQVAAGGGHTLCVKTDGTLWAWGRNDSGQLGQNNTISRSSPVQVGALTDWTQVSANDRQVACVTTAGSLFTWGSNAEGRLGHNDVANRSSPVQVGALTNWLQASTGSSHTACVTTDGTLFAWGNNGSGRLGVNDIVLRSSPVQIGALTTWAQISCGGQHTAALKTAGTLWAWGGNFLDAGQLGDGTTVNKSSPVQIGALTNWAQVSAGENHTAAIFRETTN
jgi:alpha-tubulin suppressor-like RCC1 family protein